MHLLALIFGTVLLCKANALKCYKCATSGGCENSEETCTSSATQCRAMKITSYKGGQTIRSLVAKSCVMPDQCIEGSVNFGTYKTVLTSRCCDTDLCNNEDAADPKKTTPNGKKCYSCDSTQCTSTVNCEGDEDRCIKVTVSVSTGNKTTVKGCTTKQMCTDFATTIGAIVGEVSCCQGDYCNSAGSTGASLLLLVVPLVSLVVFS